MQEPRISVVIPLGDKAAYIARTVESVLAQTVQPLEIIVVDDGSTDGGADIAASFTSPLLRVISQEKAGVSATRNAGISASKGDYVAFLDADDEYMPRFLEEIASLICNFPQAAVYSTGYFYVDPLGRRTQARNRFTDAYRRPAIVRDFFRVWAVAPFTCASSLCVKKEALLSQAIEFPAGESQGEDQDVWFRLAARYAFAHSPEPLAVYHVGVSGALTSCGPILDPLGCYLRLAETVESGQLPAGLVSGARKLVSSHYLNVCRNRLVNGSRDGAWELLTHRRAYGNPLYWLRTACLFLSAQCKPDNRSRPA